MKRILTLSALTVLGLHLHAEEVKFSNNQLDFFEKNIRPVLSGQCMDCHGNGKAKGGLSLESREAILAGGASGAAVELDKSPDKSLLIKVIRHQEEDMEMPPKGDPLSEAVILNFEKWISMGLPDPRKGETASASMAKIDVNESRDHWAFQPIKRPSPPEVGSDWVKNPIDAFILAKLKENGMKPNTKVEKRALIRRVSYALTGLPPSPEEVDMFVEDESPDAYSNLIDRLLKSPHYGERWARHWLDVARYADTSGDRRNRGEPTYPFAFTYRDYVVQSMNADKPYNQFVLEQIAADHLIDKDSKDRTSLAALGFLTVGKRFMGNANEVIDDQIDVVTQGLMGLTASCARCHDHKFDPIPQMDYYSLHGVFASSEEPDSRPYLLEPKKTAEFMEFEAKLKALEEELAEIRPKLTKEAIEEYRNDLAKYLYVIYEAERTANKSRQRAAFTKAKLNYNAALYLQSKLKKVKESDPVLGAWMQLASIDHDRFDQESGKVLASIQKSDSVNELIKQGLADADVTSMKDVSKVYDQVFNKALKEGKGGDPALQQVQMVLLNDKKSAVMPDVRDARRFVQNNLIRREEYRLQPKILKLKVEHPGSPDRAMAIFDSRRPTDSKLLIRGEARRFGDVAPRRFLEILSPAGEERERFDDGSGRLELAKEIIHPDNPLTARVIVNRVWAKYFGEGIVPTISDFGLRAEEPVHLELLDYLASWFMDNGWSLKKLHKHILMSATYQQSSLHNEQYALKDPSNSLFWKMNLQRLDFESMRDTLLMHGGSIDLTVGGRPFDVTNEKDQAPRRTLYAYIDREELPEIFRTFDFANPDMTTSRRDETTVPQQALFMMNSPLVIQQAKALMQRSEIRVLQDPQEKVRALFSLLFQRDATDEELQQAVTFIKYVESEGQEIAEENKWSYGYAFYRTDKTEQNFKPFAVFEKNQYQLSRKFPDKRFGRVSLHAEGGWSPEDERAAVIRRWTSPVNGTIRVSGGVSHQAEEGDGIIATVFVEGQGEVWKQHVENTHKKVSLELEVKKGQSIDFAVLNNKNSKGDGFDWSPIITMGERKWSALSQFGAPKKGNAEPLTAWEKLAQVLLESNEMIFLN